jgi:hypothetical protein
MKDYSDSSRSSFRVRRRSGMGTRFAIIAILISSLLAACVATPIVVTAPPPDVAVPTAAVRAPTLASLQVTPARHAGVFSTQM